MKRQNLENYLNIGLGSLESLSPLSTFFLGNGNITDYFVLGIGFGAIVYDGIQRIGSNLRDLDYKKFEKNYYETKKKF